VPTRSTPACTQQAQAGRAISGAAYGPAAAASRVSAASERLGESRGRVWAAPRVTRRSLAYEPAWPPHARKRLIRPNGCGSTLLWAFAIDVRQTVFHDFLALCVVMICHSARSHMHTGCVRTQDSILTKCSLYHRHKMMRGTQIKISCDDPVGCAHVAATVCRVQRYEPM